MSEVVAKIKRAGRWLLICRYPESPTLRAGDQVSNLMSCSGTVVRAGEGTTTAGEAMDAGGGRLPEAGRRRGQTKGVGGWGEECALGR